MPYNRSKIIKAIACVLLVAAIVLPASADPLDTLRPGHPRVMARAADFERIAELVQTDPLARQWHARLKERAQEMLDEPVAEYNLRDGRRLLYVSNEVVRRAMTLCLLDRIEPNDAYRDRVWADMEAAANFPDWHPDHFLDVAVMCTAFAVAYDWSHDRWTDEQRKTMHEAIVRHALEPGFKGYADNLFWTRTHSNWNQVCNGGLIAGALAIADREPAKAGRMVRLGVEALKVPMARYAPDGGYIEGPGYWGFGTTYNVVALSSLQSALGHDFGLGEMPGFSETGSFPRHMSGATGLTYNFGDGKARPFSSSALFYLARRFNRPEDARFALVNTPVGAMDLLWYDPALVAQAQAQGSDDTAQADESAVYRSAGVASMRSGGGGDAWYVGAKGGKMGFGHAQMDLGSFILERHGVRWLIDLGADNYNLPGYFYSYEKGDRWRYYRNRAEGHNTITINPTDKHGGQAFTATAPIALHDSEIVIDLTEAVGGSAKRTIRLDSEADRVVVTDTLGFAEPTDLWWFAHTRAQVELDDDGRGAVLTQDGKRMRARVVSPAGARFEVMDAVPLPGSPDPEGQNPNNGARLINIAEGSHFSRRGDTPRYGEPDPDKAVRKLVIRVGGVTDGRVVVEFKPVDE